MNSTIQQKLDEPIPRDVIATRPGGAGKALSYLETWYVIDRLNQIFGSENWSNEIRELTLLPGEFASYKAIVRIQVQDSMGHIAIKDGVGFGSDKPDRNGLVRNAHELAMKEAVSDALKTAAKNLGRSMGLALYDKTHEYVVDSPMQAGVPSSPPPPPPKEPTLVKSTKPEPKNVIKTALNCLLAQRKIEKADFIERYLNKKDSYSALSDVEAESAVKRINDDFPHLKLL